MSRPSFIGLSLFSVSVAASFARYRPRDRVEERLRPAGYGYREVRYEHVSIGESLRGEVTKLREMSPLWEMYKEGVDMNSVAWQAHVQDAPVRPAGRLSLTTTPAASAGPALLTTMV